MLSAGKTALIQNAFACNYLGGSEAELQAQQKQLQNFGISISPNPNDAQMCSYRTANNAWLGRVSFPSAFSVRNFLESTHREAAHILTSPGSILSSAPSYIPRHLRTADTIFVSYHVIVKRSDSFDALSVDSDRIHTYFLRKMQSTHPSANLWFDLQYLGAEQDNRHYQMLVAINRQDLSELSENNLTEDVPFTTDYCPEWTMHSPIPVPEIQPSIAGWRVIQRPDKKYWAFPLDETKKRFGDYVNKRASYSYDLSSKLSTHVLLKGDNPKLGLRDSAVQFIGSAGVVGLECPAFEFQLIEFPKERGHCTEWREAQTQAEIRARGIEIIPAGDGNFLFDPKQPDSMRYIGPESGLSTGNLGRVAKKFAERSGFDKTVHTRKTFVDELCSEWTLEPHFTKQQEVAPPPAPASAPVTVSELPQPETPAPQNTTPPQRYPIKNFPQLSDRGKKRAEEFAQLGPVTVVDVGTDETNPAGDITGNIRDIIREHRLQRQDVCFVVDQSGSMKNNINYVRNNLDRIAYTLRNSSVNNNLCLVSYVDHDNTIHWPINHSRPLEEDVSAVREKLIQVVHNLHGSEEYVADAIVLATSAWDGAGPIAAVVDGEVKEVRKIIVITDESGNFVTGGETIASARAKAAAIGAEVHIMMIKDNEPDIDFPFRGGFGLKL